MSMQCRKRVSEFGHTAVAILSHLRGQMLLLPFGQSYFYCGLLHIHKRIECRWLADTRNTTASMPADQHMSCLSHMLQVHVQILVLQKNKKRGVYYLQVTGLASKVACACADED